MLPRMILCRNSARELVYIVVSHAKLGPLSSILDNFNSRGLPHRAIRTKFQYYVL